MKKRAGFSIQGMMAFICALFVQNGFSATEISIHSNQTLMMENTTSITVNAICEIHLVSHVTHNIAIRVTRGNGIFNGTTLKNGQSMVSSLTNRQVIPIFASSGAQAYFTNLGPYAIKAICN